MMKKKKKKIGWYNLTMSPKRLGWVVLAMGVPCASIDTTDESIMKLKRGESSKDIEDILSSKLSTIFEDPAAEHYEIMSSSYGSNYHDKDNNKDMDKVKDKDKDEEEEKEEEEERKQQEEEAKKNSKKDELAVKITKITPKDVRKLRRELLLLDRWQIKATIKDVQTSMKKTSGLLASMLASTIRFSFKGSDHDVYRSWVQAPVLPRVRGSIYF